MAFSAVCPSCHETIHGVPDRKAGGRGKCPWCRSAITLAPADEPEAEPQKSRGKRQGESRTSSSVTTGKPAKQTTSGRPSPPVLKRRQYDDDIDENDKVEEAPPLRPLSPAVKLISGCSLVLGSLAFLMAAIPRTGVPAVLAGVVGVFVGLVGLMIRTPGSAGLAQAIAGPALNLLALVIALFWASSNTPPDRQTNEERMTNAAVRNFSMGGGLKGGRLTSPVEWADARQEAIFEGGALRIRITSVAVSVDDQGDHSLVMDLSIMNTGLLDQVKFVRWSALSAAGTGAMPMLRDDQARSYPLHAPSSPKSATNVRAIDMAPGKPVADSLTFDAPAANIEFLRLELPGAAFGASDNYRFQIPKQLIAFR